MDERLLKAVENMEHNALGIDDEFEFKCLVCGKCCKNRSDIILTTRDLYNIASLLSRTPEYIVERYCDVYIGQDSRIPIVRLKPVGDEQVCSLLRNKKCIVHAAKPTVCALYPLGRGVMIDENVDGTEKLEPKYFLQPDTCGTKEQTHTVRSWLNCFGIPIEDEFYQLWNETIHFLSTRFRKLESENVPNEALMYLWNFAFRNMYINYDPANEFISQYRENFEKIKDLFEFIESNPEILKKIELICNTTHSKNDR